MKRTPLRTDATPERIQRQREQRAASAQRYRDRLRARLAREGRYGTLSGGGALRPNRKRKRKRFEHSYESRERVLWTHEQGCEARSPECFGPMQVAHTVARPEGSADDTFCLCLWHHRRQHSMPWIEFQMRYLQGRNRYRIAARYATRWAAGPHNGEG